MDQGGAATTWVCRTTLDPHGPIRFARGGGVLLLVGLGVRPLFLYERPKPESTWDSAWEPSKGGRPTPTLTLAAAYIKGGGEGCGTTQGCCP